MKKGILLGLILLASVTHAQVDEALHFDGVDDYVNMDMIAPSMHGAQQAWSIEMETRYNQDLISPSAYGVLFSANESNGANKLVLRMSGAADPNYGTQGIVLYMKDSLGGEQHIYGTIPVGDNLCHHIAITYNNSAVNIYVDGVLDQTASSEFEFVLSDLFSLGQEYDSGVVPSDFFEGTLDELRLWRAELTPQQINDRMLGQLVGNEIDLFGYFSFNDGLGGTTLFNTFTPFGGDGTLVNFALTGTTSNWILDPCDCDNEENRALHFQRSNMDYVNMDVISPGLDTLTRYAFEFWVSFDDSAIEYDVIFSANSSANANRFGIRGGGPIDPNQNAISVYNIHSVTGAGEYLNGTTTVDDGLCHHVALSCDQVAGVCNLYIDGVLDATGNLSIDFLPGDKFSLGQEYDGASTSDHFNGTIDDIRIWSTQRTETEVQDNMFTAMSGSEIGLMNFYNCDQGAAGGDNSGTGTNQTELIDLAESSNGTLINFTLTDSFVSNFIQDPCACLINPLGLGMALFEDTTSTNSIEDNLNVVAGDGVWAYLEAEQLRVSTNGFWQDAQISIYDMNGKLVQTSRAVQTSSATLDVSGLSSGMFIVNVISNDRTYQSKFINR